MSAERGVEVRLCRDGPMLVTGAAQIVDEHGTAHTPRRAVVAICRCGKSGLLPYCDGTHKLRRGGDGAQA
jgi:CDGSH-type Zn-finger protein